MTKTIDHSPIAIPAGSYDAKELQELTDKAAKASEEDRAKILNEELPALGRATDEIDNRAQVGYEFRKVKNEIAPDVFVEETISVYVGGEDEAPSEKSKSGAGTTNAVSSSSAGKE